MTTVTAPVEVPGEATAAELAVSSPIALARACRIPDAPGGPAPFRIWPHQREILKALVTKRRVIILKARQLGVTRILALFALWFIMARAGVKALIVSIGEREAKAVKEHIKNLWDSLPAAVRGAFRVVQDNEKVFALQHESGLRSKVTSLPASDVAGRGETAHLLVLDEGAHYEHADERMASLLPASADVGQAVLSSTANGVGGRFADTWRLAPANGWHPIFVAADGRPDRSEEWIRVERDALEGKGAQEYPMSAEEAFLATGRCAFRVDALQDYLEHWCSPGLGTFRLIRDATGVHADEDARGEWRVWRFREPGRRYVITGDPCGGVGGADSAAMCVYDLESWDQVAAYHGRPEPDEFERQMVRAGWLWKSTAGRPALLVPESNNHGAAVVTLLREHRYPNLWAYQRLDQRRDVRQTEYGWATTTSTRRLALAALKEGVTNRQLGIRDAAAIGEMLRFVVKITANGTEREEADAGAHDDRVIAHAIAAVVLQRPAAGVFNPANPDHTMDDDPYPGDDKADAYRPRVSTVTGY